MSMQKLALALVSRPKKEPLKTGDKYQFYPLRTAAYG